MTPVQVMTLSMRIVLMSAQFLPEISGELKEASKMAFDEFASKINI